METYVIYINDKVHAMNQVLPLLEDAQPAQWVLVGCPPRIHRHSSKWLTHRALKKFKADWTNVNLNEISNLLSQRGNPVLMRVAQGPLVQLTKTLQKEFSHPRIIDARKAPEFENLPAVIESQKPESSPWAIPISAVAFGTAAALVVD
mgnify:FL=1|jgi:hypothetical protein